jgi:methylenetetrahydrofolate reductase (NADPH)
MSETGGPGEPLSRLHAACRSGRFVVTAELEPPRGSDTTALRRKARALRDWVDAANVTDNQGAVVRMASWAGCVVALEMALQADLLGASALGIRNVLLLTGDHQRFGDHPEAKGVFDLDSVELLWTARTMRDEGRLLSRRELRSKPHFLIGAVENPFAPPLAFRAERLGKKIAAGAQFVQTQYVFDVAQFRVWLAAAKELGLTERCAILAGVGPVRSLRSLERMLTIPGICIPDEIQRRLRGVPADRVRDEGIAVCAEIIEELRAVPEIAGVHVMAIGMEDAVPEILARAGLDTTRHVMVR